MKADITGSILTQGVDVCMRFYRRYDGPNSTHYHHVLTFRLTKNENIERHGRVVSTPASYSGDPGFKSRPENRLS
jgi:hypothetical protein